MSTSQTLDRGLRALELIASATIGPTVAEVATHLGVHRSIAYRIVRTLEEHHLSERDEHGRCHPGLRLAALAGRAHTPLRTVAVPHLAALASSLTMTAVLVVRDGDEAVTVESLQPSDGRCPVSYRPDIRHPVDRGAPGLAILSAGPPLRGERAEIGTARLRGWAESHGEVTPGLSSVAAPVGPSAAVGVVHPADDGADPALLASRVVMVAAHVAADLRRLEAAPPTPFRPDVR